MGQDQQEARKGSAISEMDVAQSIVEALNRIATAIESNAKATAKLAEATAADLGGDEDEPEYGLNGRPLG